METSIQTPLNSPLNSKTPIDGTYFTMFLFSVLAGATWPAGKIAAQGIPALPIAFYRYSLALPFFIFLMVFKKQEFRISPKDHPKLALLGFLGITLYNYLFLEGIKRTSASDATLIFAITPAFTLIISNFINDDDKISKLKLLGVTIAFLGVSIIFLQSPNVDVPDRRFGNILIIISAIIMASYTALSRPMFTRIKLIPFSSWTMFYGWLFLLFLVPINHSEYLHISSFLNLSSKIILSIVYLAFFIAYATIAYSNGIKNIGPSRTSIFINFVPIFGILASVIILDELLSIFYFPAFLLITSGVYLVSKSRL